MDGTTLGYTEGDATFSEDLQTRERKVAQFGENLVDIIGTGQVPTITVRIIEETKALMQALMPEAVAVGNALYFGKKPGYKLSDNAKRIILRPVKATGQTEDICLFKGVVRMRGEVGYNSENDRVHEAEIVALVDESKDDGKLLGYRTVPDGS